MNKEQTLEYLEKLTSDNVPESIQNLPPEVLNDVREYVEKVVYIKTKGVDKAFELSTVTIKFIPNFILLPLINSYIEPPIAARIAKFLTVRQVLDIVNGLDLNYVSETLLYMEEAPAAKIVLEMRPKKVAEIMQKVFNKQPLKILDIAPFIPDHKCPDIFDSINMQKFLDMTINSDRRKESLKRLREIFIIDNG